MQEIGAASPTGRLNEEAAVRMHHLLNTMESTHRWTSDLLARSTCLPADEIEALLDNMSVEFGCQPDFRIPSDENKLRPISPHSTTGQHLPGTDSVVGSTRTPRVVAGLHQEQTRSHGSSHGIHSTVVRLPSVS